MVMNTITVKYILSQVEELYQSISPEQESRIVELLKDERFTKEAIIIEVFQGKIDSKNTIYLRLITEIARTHHIDNANQKKRLHGQKWRQYYENLVEEYGEEGVKKFHKEQSMLYAQELGLPVYSDEEKAFIIAQKQKFGDKSRVNVMIAKECNKLFHNGEEIRTADSISKKYYKWKKQWSIHV